MLLNIHPFYKQCFNSNPPFQLRIKFFSFKSKILIFDPLRQKQKKILEMSSWIVFVTIESKKYQIELATLTIECLSQQVVKVSKKDQQGNILVKITSGNNCDITTDEELKKMVESEQIDLVACFRPEEFPNKDVALQKIRNPLVLLASAIQYEQQPYLTEAKQDLHILKSLFERRFGYQVFSIFPNNESLTLDNLHNFIVQHCSNLAENLDKTFYDGLIFVWCGRGIVEDNQTDILITSDDKRICFKDIQDEFVYFVRKPKIFLQITYGKEQKGNNVWYKHDTDTLTIFANTREEPIIDNENDEKRNYFTQCFCQVIQDNIHKNFGFILQQLIEIACGQTFLQKEAIQFDVCLIPKCDNADNDSKNELQSITNGDSFNTLDYKKHWNRDWKKANVEAVKMVEQMLQKNEQGVIVVIKNSVQLQNRTNTNKIANKDYSFSFNELMNSSQVEKRQFEKYWTYIIKSKLVILDNVIIDGNMYAIECEIQYKENVDITTQFFVTKNVIVDQKLKLLVSPIQWNTKIHHDIPVKINDLKESARECFEKNNFDEAILHFQGALQLSMNVFEPCHPYITDSYYNLGLAHNKKGQYDKAIEFYEKALEQYLYIFGNNHVDVADSYIALGTVYFKKRNYDEAIKYDEKALKIRKEIFGYSNRSVGDACWNLGLTCEETRATERACKYFEEAWKVYSTVLGEWDKETWQSKHRVERSTR
ncbi:hypothetical protein RFI_20781 [Reticulomyxa filosa]|uniref:Uncharacterized protein n=1 Tax=Reticulomyxa filosa TaxID=46433 RepID=X6MRV8_RETFI|nr:hypothetical protein RFI_20781 [Reticulomyxa filosa]|eukprot:ETO16559.1 hypothetical protein RFI_20781 [Reticulomyxa filosa]